MKNQPVPPRKKPTPLETKVRELQNRMRRQVTSSVPSRAAIKIGRPLTNGFERNLRGVPGGGLVGMVNAATTGTRVRKEPIGLLRSARNSNTTQGNYVTVIVH